MKDDAELLIDLLRRLEPLTIAIGSRVKGTAHKNSDVDLHLAPGVTLDEVEELIYELDYYYERGWGEHDGCLMVYTTPPVDISTGWELFEAGRLPIFGVHFRVGFTQDDVRDAHIYNMLESLLETATEAQP